MSSTSYMNINSRKDTLKQVFFKSAADADFLIAREFQDFLPSLKPREYKFLQESILTIGLIYNPLIVWSTENILIDGHHRYKIALEHNLPINVIYIELKDRSEVKAWIVQNALARRSSDGES